MDDLYDFKPNMTVQRESIPNFLKDYPNTDTVLALRELINYIYTHWKAVKCPPDMRKVVKRTAEIMQCMLSEDHYHNERVRKFLNVENSGAYSVPWKPYEELGATELNVSNLVLNNLVPSFALEKDTEQEDTDESSEKPTKTTLKDAAKIPTLVYPFPEEDQFAELTAYNLIKESLDFITKISEDLKNPNRNLQEVYERRKKEFDSRHGEHKTGGMVFIPFKAVDNTADQKIVEVVVEKFSEKLRAIIDIVNALLNMEDADIQSKAKDLRILKDQYQFEYSQLPLSRLAMVRLKRIKDVGIKKTTSRASLFLSSELDKRRSYEMALAKTYFGRQDPIWQNKYKVTGVRQFGHDKISFKPSDFMNHLRGILLRATEKIRSAGIYTLHRLESEFDRRYKYTSMALSSLPLILIQESEIRHYADSLKDIMDKAAYAKGNSNLLKNDQDLSLYLLGDLDEELLELLSKSGSTGSAFVQEMPKAVWYRMLETEADQAGILKEPRIRELLEKIYAVHNYNLPKVKYIQEKFCLLITSAPMEEVCNKAWQSAAKFIHEHIMDATEGMIDYWLAERGVPLLARKRQHTI